MEAVDIYAKKSSELIRLEKKRKDLEKEKESEEIDRAERIKTVQRHIDELGGDMILTKSLIFLTIISCRPRQCSRSISINSAGHYSFQGFHNHH